MAMRDLNECQAEVFRRSQQRIYARKQRAKRILLTCIPLVVCVSAIPLFVLSGLRAMESAPEENGMYMEMEMLSDGTTCNLSEIRLGDITITNPDMLLQLDSLLDSLSPNKQHSATGNTTATEDHEIGQLPEEKGCIFITVDSNGTQTEYQLVNNTLKNRTDGWTCSLTTAQAEVLLSLLTD